jgi:RNA polymerase sigma factor FliA
VDRDSLVRESLPLVHRVAKSLASRLPRQVEIADLTQAGVLGLLDAADKFDSDKGVRFSTYAELRIRGAILDSLRSLDWVPRSLRRRRRDLKGAESRLQGLLGRSPSEGELATELDMTIPELRATRERVERAEVACEVTESVDEILPFVSDPAAVDPEELIERKELEALIARAIDALPERERLVLALYYYEELTMKEVGEVLGVNESRISQIHSKLVSKLRRRLHRELRPRPEKRLARTA